MAGTKHFSRMSYNVNRGLREIVAPVQTMSKHLWKTLKDEFSNQCAYCGHPATKKNRGIVPDHLIPVTEYGELVLGNTVPSCQACNDSRGKENWETFIKKKFPKDANKRIAKIKTSIKKHKYCVASPEFVFSKEEQDQYHQLFDDWETLLNQAQKLQDVVSKKRKKMR